MKFADFLNSRLPVKSQADATTKSGYVQFGYGQVEPNHLSAQRNGQIYAQLPAAPEIDILEQGQFVKYDYAANDNGIGQVDFTGAGEWMMVFNEIKLYRTHADGSQQWDCEFAMLKDDYQARVYSPYDWELPEETYHTRYLNGVDENGASSMTVKRAFVINPSLKTVDIGDERLEVTYDPDTKVYSVEYNGETHKTEEGGLTFKDIEVTYNFDDVTKDVEDIYEWGFTSDPWEQLGLYKEKKMRQGTAMVPRVIKTMVGDIFTTNMIAESELAIGDIVAPNDKGILSKSGDTDAMKWQVVKIYTMPDGQPGVKLMRIA